MKKVTFLLAVILVMQFSSGITQPVWTQKASHNGAPRYDFAGFSLNNKGYIGGGRYGGAFNSISEWQEYDPAANSWIIITPMPYPFTALSAFEIGGWGYVANGVNDAMYNYDTFKYNQAGNNWSTLSSLSYPRLNATSATVGTNGYIIGGYGFMAEALCDLWEYNSILDAWTEKAPLPANAARYYASAFTVNGELFVFGGTNGMEYLNDLWEYNPSSNQWIQKSSMPAAGRQQSTSFVLNNNAYIVGGTPLSGPDLKEVWRYHAATDTWLQLADFPGANAPFGGVAFTINGKGYIVNGNGTSECWEFDPGTVGIEAEPELAKISLFPNPVVNKSVIDISGKPDGTYQLDIYNSLGQRIKSYKAIHSQLTIENNDFDKGLYFIKINNGSTESETIKFTIK
jgi:N-acetylneuraminic acid mutarotase